jgi:hypothetical protein
MNSITLRFLLRAIILILIQVLVLKRIGTGSQWIWQHGQIFIYPVLILMMPFRVGRLYVILAGFFTGLVIDIFYDTVGVHAFAMTAMAYSRGILLSWLEPRGGYQLAMTPTHYSMGFNWLISYTAAAFGIFTFMYFVAEIFTFVFIGRILLNTLLTFAMSMVVVMGYHLLFNPRR